MPTDMLITNNALTVQIITPRHLRVCGATAQPEAEGGGPSASVGSLALSSAATQSKSRFVQSVLF